MRLFKDNEGREWRVEINVAQVKRVRSLAGVDIYKMGDDFLQRFGELLQDVVLLVDVLFVLCMDQARQEQVSDEDFGRALGGDALDHASDAFVKELVDFFPGAQMRALLREALLKQEEMLSAAAEAGREALRKLDAAGEVQRLTTATNGRSTSAPAGSASTPAR